MSTAAPRDMFDPIVVWFGVAVVSGSLAWIVAAGAHHARLARFGALVGISAMVAVGYLAAGARLPARSSAPPSEIAAHRTRHYTIRVIAISAPSERVWHPAGRLAPRAFDRVARAPAHFVHERRLVIHLRHRAVARPVRIAGDGPGSVPWFFALGVAMFSALAALIARRGWGWVAVFAVSAIALLVLPLAHLPPAIGLLWTLGALGAVASLALRGPPDHVPRF